MSVAGTPTRPPAEVADRVAFASWGARRRATTAALGKRGYSFGAGLPPLSPHRPRPMPPSSENVDLSTGIFLPIIKIRARLKLLSTRIAAAHEPALRHSRRKRSRSSVRTRSGSRGARRRKAARWRRKCVQKEAGAAKRFGSGLFRFGTLVTP
jgi:hypothetical protein